MADETTPAEDQQRVQIRVDQSDMETCYANAFQTNGTAEELFVSLEINQAVPAQEGHDAQMLLKMESRVVTNWYTAKRLAMQLSQAVRQHEAQFGELQLDVASRVKPAAE